jgi:hypothetical protein
MKIRKLKVKNTINNTETILTHYQVTNWPDGDRPLP